MDILKTATEWAKAEVYSSLFFILFGSISVLASIGFWQLGKTDLAKAYIFPTLVAGVLLLIVGIGLFSLNRSRATSFPEDYGKDAKAFVQTELDRSERSMKEYSNVVFKVIPVIIAVAALLFIFFDKPLMRAICVTIIAMMGIIMIIDSNAHARLKGYNHQLEKAIEHDF